MTRPSPPGTHALLIGTSHYPRDKTLGDRPSVLNNLRDMRSVLTDPAIGGLPPSHCHILADPPDRQAIAETLDEVAELTTGTFLVYYAGHGLLDDDTHDLHLGVCSSSQRLVADTSFPYARLPQRMRLSRAASRVVILDCCFSGLAADTMLSGAVATRATAQMTGAFTLTSTSSIMPAFSLPQEEHTAFTSRLLKILQLGIDGGPEHLDLDLIYNRLFAELRADNLPAPRKLARDGGSAVALARNVAWAHGEDAPHELTPTLDSSVLLRADEVAVTLSDDDFIDIGAPGTATEEDARAPSEAGGPDSGESTDPLPGTGPESASPTTMQDWSLPGAGGRRVGRSPPTTAPRVRLGGPDERLSLLALTAVVLVAIVITVAIAIGLLSLI